MTGRPDPHEDVQGTKSTPLPGNGSREVELDEVVSRRTVPHRRVIQTGSLIALLLVVVGGLVFHNYQGVQSESSADPSPMDVEVYTNVTNGVLTLNGKLMSVHLPTIVTLRQGVNTVTITANSFQPHTCTVEMSEMRAFGGCAVSTGRTPPITLGAKRSSSRLLVPFTLTDLLPAQRDSMRALVKRTLDTLVFHTAVPAQQYIATGIDLLGHITSRLTVEPLRGEATLVLRADQDSKACPEGICPADDDQFRQPHAAGALWAIVVMVTPHWQFTTSAGTVMATSKVENIAAGRLQMTLAYGTTGTAASWTVYSMSGDGNSGGSTPLDLMTQQQCGAALSVLFTEASTGAGGVAARTQPHGLNGCELQLLDGDSKPAGLFIWRFGVLLAADTAAHARVPGLPIAPQAEIDVVISHL